MDRERLERLKEAAEGKRGRLTIHAWDTSTNRDRFRETLCGAVASPEQISGGAQWRDRMKDPHVTACPDCVELWNALTDDQRRLLQV